MYSQIRTGGYGMEKKTWWSALVQVSVVMMEHHKQK